jgi:hypothetical protein
MKRGHRRNHLSAIIFMFLDFPDKIANPTIAFLGHPTAQLVITYFLFPVR